MRGVALILMVVNHTSRDWMDVLMGWPRYHLVYGSLLLPAAIFLFLVGFCLPISYHHRGHSEEFLGDVRRYFRRGVGIVAAGYLLNLIMLPRPPVPPEERVAISPLGRECHRVTVHYGFKDEVDLPLALQACAAQGLPIDPMKIALSRRRSMRTLRCCRTPLPSRLAIRLATSSTARSARSVRPSSITGPTATCIVCSGPSGRSATTI